MLVAAFADFLWSPETKQLYYADGKPVGPSTYERPSAVSYFSSTMPPRYLCPADYATYETAAKVEAGVRAQWPSLKITTVAANSSGVSFPQLLVAVEHATNGKAEVYAAGRLAFTYDKNGAEAAKQSFEAELKQAGLL